MVLNSILVSLLIVDFLMVVVFILCLVSDVVMGFKCKVCFFILILNFILNVNIIFYFVLISMECLIVVKYVLRYYIMVINC